MKKMLMLLCSFAMICSLSIPVNAEVYGKDTSMESTYTGYCPLSTSHSNATVSAYVSGGRAYAIGYITYYDPYVETLTGSSSWGWV